MVLDRGVFNRLVLSRIMMRVCFAGVAKVGLVRVVRACSTER